MPNTPLTGRFVGNYVLKSLIGQGGMSSVYSGSHRFLGDKVAIKLLRGSFADNPALAQRFFEEARTARQIDHPNIVKILDFGQSEEDTALYLVMELLEGRTLARVIAKEWLDELTSASIGASVADGLLAVHEKGVVHRDLKPDNIFVCVDGRVKILDFGVAKLLANPDRTALGAVLGTPQYMAPEQAKKTRRVGPYTDVYALGVVMFKMLTGRLPFVANDPVEMIARHVFTPPPAPSQFAPVSPQMDAIVLRCLEKDSDKRFPSMAELSATLRAVAGDETPIVERLRRLAVAGPDPEGVSSTPSLFLQGLEDEREGAAMHVPALQELLARSPSNTPPKTQLATPESSRSMFAHGGTINDPTMFEEDAANAARGAHHTRTPSEPLPLATTPASTPAAMRANGSRGAVRESAKGVGERRPAARPVAIEPTPESARVEGARAERKLSAATPALRPPEIVATEADSMIVEIGEPERSPSRGGRPRIWLVAGAAGLLVAGGVGVGVLIGSSRRATAPPAGVTHELVPPKPTAPLPPTAPLLPAAPTPPPPAPIEPTPEPSPPPPAAAPIAAPAATPDPPHRTPAAAEKIVIIRSEPPGAQVLIDQQPRGITPTDLSLPLPQEITVTLPGYRPGMAMVRKAGTVRFRLVPEFAPVRMKTPLPKPHGGKTTSKPGHHAPEGLD